MLAQLTPKHAIAQVLDSSAGETVREGSAEKRVVDFEWFVDRDAIAEPSGLMHGLQRILRLPFFGASWKQRLGAKRFALMEVALTTEQGDGEEEGEGEGEHREWEEEERVNEAGGLGDGVDEHI